MDQNHGVLVAPPKPTDYILGAETKVNVERKIKDWSIYLSKPEDQTSTVSDFLICVTMSGVDHSIGTQLNYLMSQNLLSDEALNFFHQERYIKDGVFDISSRFSAKLNGTDVKKGNYINAVAESARTMGFAPESDWPTTKNMSWTEFYLNPPLDLIKKAKKVLWWLDIQYQWVAAKDIATALSIAPVQCSISTCPDFNNQSIISKCDIPVPNHSILTYHVDSRKNWQIEDQYFPYLKTLSQDYSFPMSLQYIVNAKPMSLRNGMHGSNVLNMQTLLVKLGYAVTPDSEFGPRTEAAVKLFQSKNGLLSDGIAGPLTLAKLAAVSMNPPVDNYPKIDLFCEAIKQHEGYFPGSRSYKNNNPGNLRVEGDLGRDSGNFGIFSTYEKGFARLKLLVMNACSGKSSLYNPDGTLLQFFAGIPPFNKYPGYAPASDGNNPTIYAKLVADKMSVSPQIKIKDLL